MRSVLLLKKEYSNKIIATEVKPLIQDFGFSTPSSLVDTDDQVFDKEKKKKKIKKRKNEDNQNRRTVRISHYSKTPKTSRLKRRRSLSDNFDFFDTLPKKQKTKRASPPLPIVKEEIPHSFTDCPASPSFFTKPVIILSSDDDDGSKKENDIDNVGDYNSKNQEDILSFENDDDDSI
jgi:hypothetical protein